MSLIIPPAHFHMVFFNTMANCRAWVKEESGPSTDLNQQGIYRNDLVRLSYNVNTKTETMEARIAPASYAVSAWESAPNHLKREFNYGWSRPGFWKNARIDEAKLHNDEELTELLFEAAAEIGKLSVGMCFGDACPQKASYLCTGIPPSHKTTHQLFCLEHYESARRKQQSGIHFSEPL